MAEFFGIAPGEERVFAGLRIRVSEDGERVWMHGKWLDLGEDHAVAVIQNSARFERPDGRRLLVGEFPAWVVSGKKVGRKPAPYAMMFNISQFRGGHIEVK